MILHPYTAWLNHGQHKVRFIRDVDDTSYISYYYHQVDRFGDILCVANETQDFKNCPLCKLRYPLINKTVALCYIISTNSPTLYFQPDQFYYLTSSNDAYYQALHRYDSLIMPAESAATSMLIDVTDTNIYMRPSDTMKELDFIAPSISNMLLRTYIRWNAALDYEIRLSRISQPCYAQQADQSLVEKFSTTLVQAH